MSDPADDGRFSSRAVRHGVPPEWERHIPEWDRLDPNWDRDYPDYSHLPSPLREARQACDEVLYFAPKPPFRRETLWSVIPRAVLFAWRRRFVTAAVRKLIRSVEPDVAAKRETAFTLDGRHASSAAGWVADLAGMPDESGAVAAGEHIFEATANVRITGDRFSKVPPGQPAPPDVRGWVICSAIESMFWPIFDVGDPQTRRFENSAHPGI